MGWFHSHAAGRFSFWFARHSNRMCNDVFKGLDARRTCFVDHACWPALSFAATTVVVSTVLSGRSVCMCWGTTNSRYRNTAVPGTLEARGTWYTLRSSVHSNSILSRTWGVFFIGHFTDYSKLQKVQNRKCVYGVPRGVPQCTTVYTVVLWCTCYLIRTVVQQDL